MIKYIKISLVIVLTISAMWSSLMIHIYNTTSIDSSMCTDCTPLSTEEMSMYSMYIYILCISTLAFMILWIRNMIKNPHLYWVLYNNTLNAFDDYQFPLRSNNTWINSAEGVVLLYLLYYSVNVVHDESQQNLRMMNLILFLIDDIHHFSKQVQTRWNFLKKWVFSCLFQHFVA